MPNTFGMSPEDGVTGSSEELASILHQAKALAARYRLITGKPLGVTGEVAEYEATRLLGYTLCGARQCGFDAVSPAGQRVQIKGRVLQKGTKQGRLGSIDIKTEWDAVLLVLMDENLDTTAMYEADRDKVIAAIMRDGSIARQERGQLAINQFRAIGRRLWPPDTGPHDASCNT